MKDTNSGLINDMALESINSIGKKVKAEVLTKVAERNNDLILIISPYETDFYRFFRTPKRSAITYGFPVDIESRVQIVSSIGDVSLDENYALVISGIWGYEVIKQDIGKPDYSIDAAFGLFDELGKRDIPVATLTECPTVGAYGRALQQPNMLYYGTRPTDDITWSYIFNCYSRGEVMPLPRLESTDKVVGLFDKILTERGKQQFWDNLREVEEALNRVN